jgi:hypothetical protein
MHGIPDYYRVLELSPLSRLGLELEKERFAKELS